MIEGKNVCLRTVKEEDLALLYRCLDSIRMKGEFLSAHLLSEHSFRLEFFETGFWTEEKGVLLVVHEKVVGALWYERQKKLDFLEISFYIFEKQDRKKGWMKEALRLFCRYLFAVYKIQRLQVSVPNYSQEALKLVQKCHFQFEGIARSACFQNGRYVDLCVYSLLRGE